jgi:CspA family cold shock protein
LPRTPAIRRDGAGVRLPARAAVRGERADTGVRDTTTLTRVIPRRTVRPFAMANGTVDFFNDTGGYGFIETEDADDDVFFHMEDVGGPDLEEGQEVEFEIEDSPKGPRAANLVRN